MGKVELGEEARGCRTAPPTQRFPAVRGDDCEEAEEGHCAQVFEEGQCMRCCLSGWLRFPVACPRILYSLRMSCMFHYVHRTKFHRMLMTSNFRVEPSYCSRLHSKRVRRSGLIMVPFHSFRYCMLRFLLSATCEHTQNCECNLFTRHMAMG